MVEIRFLIDRDVNKINQIFEDLFDDDLGLIEKRSNNYSVRCGQTNQPIPDHPVRPIQFIEATKKHLQEFILTETGERWNFVDGTVEVLMEYGKRLSEIIKVVSLSN